MVVLHDFEIGPVYVEELIDQRIDVHTFRVIEIEPLIEILEPFTD